MLSIKTNLAAIKKSIADYEYKYHRNAGSVNLLAVSKGQPLAKIIEAYSAGQRAFGENYLQEALPKIETLANYPQPIEWHFIGTIQTNKTKKIAEHFSWVHSINQIKIAERLNNQRPATLPPLNICIEVNTSHENSKSGIDENAIDSLVHACLTLPKLNLRGFMAIPAPQKNIEMQRKEFHQLFLLLQHFRTQGIALDTLSMGMSDDFEAAIAEGSTFVRIGTAIFGKRS